MRPELKKALLLVVTSVIAALGLIVKFYLTDDTSAGSVKVLESIEQIAYTLPEDWGVSSVREVPPGKTAIAVLEIEGKECDPMVTPQDAIVRVMLPYETTVPSYQGGRTGRFYEWLAPLNSETCKLSSYRLVEWIPTAEGDVKMGVGEDLVTVSIILKAAPTPLEFFIGAQNSYLWQGHCGGYCNMEADLGHKYAQALRSYGVTPMDSHVILPPVKNGKLDLDATGEFSFRKLILNYSTEHVYFPPAPRTWSVSQRTAYYQAMQNTVVSENLVGRAWVYLWDEPTSAQKSALLAELSLAKSAAPSVKMMVTTTYDSTLNTYIDVYAPVLNLLGRKGYPLPLAYSGKGLWPYVSCMDSCGPNRADNVNVSKDPGPDTGLPDMLIDRPSSFIFNYVKELRDSGADAGLYYSAVEGYRLVPMGIDIQHDAWNFGGHGDGLLFVPGRPNEMGLTEHLPIPSWRLVVLRAALEGVK